MSHVFLYVIIFVASFSVFLYNTFAEQPSNSHASISVTNNFIEINSTTEGAIQSLHIPKESLLFDMLGHTYKNGNRLSLYIKRKPELQNLYKELELAKGL